MVKILSLVSLKMRTENSIPKKIFINGEFCKTKDDFWNKHVAKIAFESGKYFGKNLDDFNDAVTSGGPGFPGDYIIEIIETKKLEEIFGKENFDFIIGLLKEAEFVDLIIEKSEE